MDYLFSAKKRRRKKEEEMSFSNLKGAVELGTHGEIA
jgi:hypothetical protein